MSFVDGLSSGLDTTAIIDASIAVERLPQDRLVQRRARSQAAADELGTLRTDVTALRTAAADLRLSSGWNRLVGTSSSESTTVAATAGGFTGSLSFQVDSLATTNVIYSNTVFETLESSTGSGGSLSQIVESINGDNDLNYVAVAIRTGNGYRLQLAAKEGGAASQITSDAIQAGVTGGFTTLTEGADAQITFAGLNPYSITSTSNTFVGLMPGVDVTVSETSVTPVTITVEHDYEQIADSVSALVDQFNALKTKMAASTRVDPGLAQQVPLAFNGNVRRAEQSMLRAIVDPVSASSFEAPSIAGIELQRDGTLTFDRDKFLEAAKTDIGELTALFSTGDEGTGLLDRLVAAADEASAFGTGLLSSAQESEKSRIESFTEQIDSYESRLERKEEQLRKIYANLEVALGTLSNQGNWLAGQLGSLSNGNSQ
mgnify:CR=1 FL=1